MLQHTEVNIVSYKTGYIPIYEHFSKKIFFESVFQIFFFWQFFFFLYKKAKEFLYVLFTKVVFRYLKKQSRLLFR